LLLSGSLGYEVDVLTTCSKGYQTWKNDLPAGNQRDGSLRVYRFPVEKSLAHPFSHPLWRSVGMRFMKIYRKHLSFLPQLWLDKWEQAWIEWQGPFCPQLINHLTEHENRYQSILFFTYLYFPTLMGLPEVAKKAILIPFAHDEPAFYFKKVRSILMQAAKVLVCSKSEAKLIKQSHPGVKVEIVGYGLKFPPLRPKPESSPFLLYIGRLNTAKGVKWLIAAFLKAKAKFPQLRLVLCGELSEKETWVFPSGTSYLGVVDEVEKAQLLAECLCLVNPSRFESLSIVTLEAIRAMKPVLVNGKCSVLADYASEMPTVFAFRGQRSFVAQIERLLDPHWQSVSGQALAFSYAKIQEDYLWDNVLKRLNFHLLQVVQSG
jgi:glycosyltransferase involved in cell wall biosynthesis